MIYRHALLARRLRPVSTALGPAATFPVSVTKVLPPRGHGQAEVDHLDVGRLTAAWAPSIGAATEKAARAMW
jgi:hypothetical protein